MRTLPRPSLPKPYKVVALNAHRIIPQSFVALTWHELQEVTGIPGQTSKENHQGCEEEPMQPNLKHDSVKKDGTEIYQLCVIIHKVLDQIL